MPSMSKKLRQRPAKKRSKTVVTMDDVRVYLDGQDKNALADMLMKRAMDDDRLRQRLLMKAAGKAPRGLGLATYRHTIDEVVDVGGFVDYRGAFDYARGIEDVIDSVEELLKDGHADEVIELTEHALEAVEDAMGSVDDSDVPESQEPRDACGSVVDMARKSARVST